ncbi:hypothetical protein NL676_038873 [Syzygium grande]|nr:hypothetical protein NL676_038873 [Syzygium grande]
MGGRQAGEAAGRQAAVVAAEGGWSDPKSGAASCGLRRWPHTSRVSPAPNPIDSAALPTMDGNNIPLPLFIVLTSPVVSAPRARNQWFSGLLSRVSSSGSPELGEVRSRFAMASSGDGEKRREPQDATGPRSSIDTSSVECGPSSRVSRGQPRDWDGGEANGRLRRGRQWRSVDAAERSGG